MTATPENRMNHEALFDELLTLARRYEAARITDGTMLMKMCVAITNHMRATYPSSDCTYDPWGSLHFSWVCARTNRLVEVSHSIDIVAGSNAAMIATDVALIVRQIEQMIDKVVRT